MKILIIQTAFIGDVVLATAIIEKLYDFYPQASIDFLLRKGNEGLLVNHPYINRLIIFDKRHRKILNMWDVIKNVRLEKYDYVINLHRFASSGLITVLSGAGQTSGFDKNPFSLFFNRKIKHEIYQKQGDKLVLEVERNQALIAHFTDKQYVLPKLYPSEKDYEKVKTTLPYICIAPASVWFTKQFPVEKWVALINEISEDSNFKIYLLGAAGDYALCNEIKERCNRDKEGLIEIMAGKLSFLESAALMKNAKMNFCNDSAPLHIASAMNAPVTAVFCSTVPQFGFVPLSEQKFVIETAENLSCRPCGLHGHRKCPKQHFRCANNISVDDIWEKIKHIF